MQNHVAKVHLKQYVYKDEDDCSQEDEQMHSRISESETSSRNSSQTSEDSIKESHNLQMGSGDFWEAGSHAALQSQESLPTGVGFENEKHIASPKYPESHPQPEGLTTGTSYPFQESLNPIPSTSFQDARTLQQETPSQESQEHSAMHSSTPYNSYTTQLLLGLDKTHHHNFPM